MGGSGVPNEEVDDREARYQAWAERLRAKRVRSQAAIRDAQQGPAPTADSPTYWAPDALFAESQRVADQHDDGRSATAELLATLDLRDGADPDQVGAAYRRLAKAHHPDRHLHADEPTREFHDARMREITRAYQALRQRELA
jgi:DnaJ-domain-containing protein 1